MLLRLFYTFYKPSILLIFLITCSTTELSADDSTAEPPTIEFDRIEENIIHFKSSDHGKTPPPLKTELYEMNHLGILKNGKGGQPYFVFTARPCKQCLQDQGVYLIKPTGGRIESFVYPGKIVDSKTGNVVLESRAFFGKCLPKKDEVYVVYQKEVIDRKRGSRVQSSVFIAEPGTDYLDEKLIERRLPNVNETLRYVKKKTCQEIDGRNRRMLSKPVS